MTKHTTQHATFVIERTFNAPPALVFSAWSQPEAKSKWFTGPDGKVEHRLDFRVGGAEYNRGTAPDGTTYTYEARYQDIVPNERIIYSYDMHLEDARISVSQSTVEFHPDGACTRMVYTEQAVFLDGLDKPEFRERGSRDLFDNLERQLRRMSGKA